MEADKIRLPDFTKLDIEFGSHSFKNFWSN